MACIMEDKNILQHLLEVEGKAASLVNDAQEEADRRIKEAEEQNRLVFDGEYQKLTAELETECQKELDKTKAEYDKSLDEHRESLDAMPRDNNAFSAMAFSLLLGEE
jgi:vacuolar-type H+-ATPase subunit H